MSFRFPPLPIEYVSEKLRHHYRRQAPYDNGLDERRAASKLRPHSERISNVQIKRPGTAQPAPGLTQGK
jgi:hypothetical protein